MPVRLNKGLLSHHFQFPSLTQYTTSLSVIFITKMLLSFADSLCRYGGVTLRLCSL